MKNLLSTAMAVTVFSLPQAIGPCGGSGGGSSDPKPVNCEVIIGFPIDTTPPVTDKSGAYDLVDTWTPISTLWAACSRKWRALKIDLRNGGDPRGHAVSIYLQLPDSITRRGKYTWVSPRWNDGITREDWEAAHLNIVT